MTFPAILFSVLAACLYGCIYHLIRGGNFFSLLVYMLVSIIGFFLGNVVGNIMPELITLGQIHIVYATAGSALCLFICGLIGNPLF